MNFTLSSTLKVGEEEEVDIFIADATQSCSLIAMPSSEFQINPNMIPCNVIAESVMRL